MGISRIGDHYHTFCCSIFLFCWWNFAAVLDCWPLLLIFLLFLSTNQMDMFIWSPCPISKWAQLLWCSKLDYMPITKANGSEHVDDPSCSSRACQPATWLKKKAWFCFYNKDKREATHGRWEVDVLGLCMNGFLSNPLRNDCWEEKVTWEKKRTEKLTERSHFLHELAPVQSGSQEIFSTSNRTCDQKMDHWKKKKNTRFHNILFIYLISDWSDSEFIYVEMKISKDLY